MKNNAIRLHNLMDAAGIPVKSVQVSRTGEFSLFFADDVTKEQREQAAVILAAFDPNEPDPRDVRRTRLKELLAIEIWTEDEQEEATRLTIREMLE